jgi:CheY-like chemotaxis protein
LLSQKHILFVEDNRISQKVGMRMLHALGCRAKLAADGEECLAAMKKERFDLVLMDCQVLPIMLACFAAAAVGSYVHTFERLPLSGRCR